jgi:hypothetical protein
VYFLSHSMSGTSVPVPVNLYLVAGLRCVSGVAVCGSGRVCVCGGGVHVGSRELVPRVRVRACVCVRAV